MEKPYYRKISREEFKGIVRDLTGKSTEHSQVKRVLKEAGAEKLKYRSSLSKREALKAIEGIKKVVSQDIKSGKAGALRGKFDFRRESAKQIYEKKTMEFTKSQKPGGPSKEELSRQRRKEEALQIVHRRERADEIRAEQKKPIGPTTPGGKISPPPPLSQGVTPQGRNSLGYGTVSPRAPLRQNSSGRKTSDKEARTFTLAILPFGNVSSELELDSLGKRASRDLILKLAELTRLNFVEQDKLVNILVGWDVSSNRIIQTPMMEKVANVTKADFVIAGEFQKFEEEIQITVRIFEKEAKKVHRLPKVNGLFHNFSTVQEKIIEKVRDFFEKVLQGQKGKSEANLTTKPEDLWID